MHIFQLFQSKELNKEAFVKLMTSLMSLVLLASGLLPAPAFANEPNYNRTVVIQTQNTESMFDGQFQLKADDNGNVAIEECPPTERCKEIARLSHEELGLVARYLIQDAQILRGFKKGTKFILGTAAVIGGIALPGLQFAGLAVAAGAGGACAINTDKSAQAKCGEALEHALGKSITTFPTHTAFVDAEIDFATFRKILNSKI